MISEELKSIVGRTCGKSYSTYGLNRRDVNMRDPRIVKRHQNDKSQLASAIQRANMMRKPKQVQKQKSAKQVVEQKYGHVKTQIDKRKHVLQKTDEQIREQVSRARELNERLLHKKQPVQDQRHEEPEQQETAKDVLDSVLSELF